MRRCAKTRFLSRFGVAAGALAFALGLTACARSELPSPALPAPVTFAGDLTTAERAYVGQTASVVYRRASVERLEGLLFSDERGHGVCVRSPAGAVEAADYTLLILQRRITGDFISQAADDVLILRSASDASPCRRLGGDSRLWVPAN